MKVKIIEFFKKNVSKVSKKIYFIITYKKYFMFIIFLILKLA